MMQPDNREQAKRARTFLPWIVLGGAAVVVICVILVRSVSNKPPPKPAGQYLVARVNLIIQSNVGGAEVYLDDELKGVTSDTQHKVTIFNLRRQTYQVVLKKPGYADRTEPVEITGRSISQTAQIDMQAGGSIE